jgi:hypothetical protein
MAKNRRGRPARRPAPYQQPKRNTKEFTAKPEGSLLLRGQRGFFPMSREEILGVAAAARGRYLVPLCEAVAFAGIALGVIRQRAETIPLPPRPTWVVVVGDDPIGGALGPSGFGDLKLLLRQATLIAVCSGAAVPAVYAGAAAIAAGGGRVVIVETRVERTRRGGRWCAVRRRQRDTSMYRPSWGVRDARAPHS